jgi:putative MATE family efflux protein
MTAAPLPRPAPPAPPAPLRLLPLAWPLFIELWLGIAVGIVGTALAARSSDTAGAAFALANQVTPMLFIFFRIIGAGIGVVVTQSLGAARRDRADALARAALGASSWVGGLCTLGSFFGAHALLQLLNAPAEVMPLAEPFVMALAPVLIFDAWNASMASVMRAHLRGRDTLVVIVVMHLVHLSLALVLMLGAGPLPSFGLVGFAWAMLASRVVGVVLHLYLWHVRLSLRPSLQDFWRLPRAELGAIAHIGLPGAAENIAYRLCFTVSVAVLATFGASSLATQAYASQITYLGLLFGLATGFAVEILVGHMVGAGRLHEAQALVRRALLRGLVVSVLVTVAVALGGAQLMALFTNDPAIISLGATLLWCTVLIEPGRTFNLVVVNALRAAGDARYPVMAGAASFIVVLAGGSWLFGKLLGFGLVGVWLAYAADEWIRGLLMWQRWRSLRWVPHARAARRRVLR